MSQIEPVDPTSPSEVNYGKILTEIGGLEVGYDEFLLSDKPLGTRRLDDCASVVIFPKDVANTRAIVYKNHRYRRLHGATHIFTVGQPQRPLVQTLEALAQFYQRNELACKFICGFKRDYEQLIQYFNRLGIEIQFQWESGFTRQHAIFVPGNNKLRIFADHPRCLIEGPEF